MKLFRGLAVAGAALALAIAVLGSWVRINDAGLTCPDWPLCHGRLVPTFAGGVVLEWSHRVVAFIESFVVLGVVVSGYRERERIAGAGPVLAALGIVFALQVSLGGATVLLANSPLSVMLHWGTGMALLALLTILAVLAVVAPHPGDAIRLRFGETAAPALALAALFAFATMCAGAYVSSSYAGLACTTLPACDGTLFGNGPAQFVQMLHRILAGTFALAGASAALVTVLSGSPRAKRFALTGAALIVLQIALGAANVAWQLPAVLRAAHAANACATFLAFVIAAALAALDPISAHVPAERAVASRHVAPLA